MTPANAIVGTATDSSSASVGWAARWRTSGPESPSTCRATACDVAALALGAAAGVQPGVAQPGLDVDGCAQLVAEQREGRVAERERRVQGDRGRHRGQRAALQAEQVADAAVVRRHRLGAAGEREPVAVHSSPCK